MNPVTAAAYAAALLTTAAPAWALQVGNPATPRVGTISRAPVGPPAPTMPATMLPRTGPLPSNLSLAQALDEAAARSPAASRPRQTWRLPKRVFDNRAIEKTPS